MKENFVLDERCIPSEDVRKFINEIGWKFTDKEIASLVYNNSMNRVIKNMEILENMLDEFTDKSVISEIKEKIKFEKERISFIKASGRNIIFKLIPGMYEDELGDDNPYATSPILFSTFDAAFNHALKMKPKFGFDIIKSPVFENTDDAILHGMCDEEYDAESYLGEIDFDENYEISYYHESTLDQPGIKLYFPTDVLSDDDPFYDLSVAIPCNFHKGDILYDMIRDEIGILRADDFWYFYMDDGKLIDRFKPIKDVGGFASDNYPIEIVDDDGLFTHHHSQTQFLRRVKESDYINQEQKEVYESANRMVSGENCYIQEFQMFLNSYIASDKSNHSEEE